MKRFIDDEAEAEAASDGDIEEVAPALSDIDLEDIRLVILEALSEFETFSSEDKKAFLRTRVARPSLVDATAGSTAVSAVRSGLTYAGATNGQSEQKVPAAAVQTKTLGLRPVRASRAIPAVQATVSGPVQTVDMELALPEGDQIRPASG